MSRRVITSPWDNPVLPEGVHNAVVKSVMTGRYGTQDDPFVQIRFWLVDAGQHLLTNLFFPKDAMQRSQRRLWHFTRTVGLQPADVAKSPGLFEGRNLRLDLREYDGTRGSYSDVFEFLPALPLAANQETASSAKPPASKAKQYRVVEYTD